jgi:hypothetical protein
MPIPPEIKRLYYGYDWQTKIRPRELQRAKNCCERCHRPWKPLDLAHLDGNPANRDPSNLCVLCRPCHRRNDYVEWAGKTRATRIRKKDAKRPILEYLKETQAIAAQAAVDRAIEGVAKEVPNAG